MSRTADEYYAKLVIGIASADLTRWQEQIENAERNRMNDRSVMDILGASRPTAEPAAANPPTRTSNDSILHWIQLAIDVEEKQ